MSVLSEDLAPSLDWQSIKGSGWTKEPLLVIHGEAMNAGSRAGGLSWYNPLRNLFQTFCSVSGRYRIHSNETLLTVCSL